MLDRFLSPYDSHRVAHTFAKLARHDISRWVLTGGLATEMHCLLQQRPVSSRPLNDIDFVAESFDCIPASLADDFLFRHIHPLDLPGKTLLQFVDPETAIRVDVFRAFGSTMNRTSTLPWAGHTVRLIALEDLVARAARLVLDLAGGVPTPAKHAGDFLRLAELVHPANIEEAWQDQRKSHHPETFRQTKLLLESLIQARHDLLMVPEYSRNPEQHCPRCASTAAFGLADPRLILSLLGYC